ncbi:unnamed protein product, partial [Rotaria sp. Silwood2]
MVDKSLILFGINSITGASQPANSIDELSDGKLFLYIIERLVFIFVGKLIFVDEASCHSSVPETQHLQVHQIHTTTNAHHDINVHKAPSVIQNFGGQSDRHSYDVNSSLDFGKVHHNEKTTNPHDHINVHKAPNVSQNVGNQSDRHDDDVE